MQRARTPNRMPPQLHPQQRRGRLASCCASAHVRPRSAVAVPLATSSRLWPPPRFLPLPMNFNPSPFAAPGGALSIPPAPPAPVAARSKQAAAMAAVDVERQLRDAANARATSAAASSNAAAASPAASSARAATAQSPAASADFYPHPPTDTRKLLAFLLRQDYGCHGPLLARSGKSASGSAQAAAHFFALKVAEEKRRKSTDGAAQPPLPDASFALLRPSATLPSTASIDSVMPERLQFFTALHAYRFEQTQQMALSTLVEYYSSIWEEVRGGTGGARNEEEDPLPG